MLGEVTVDAVGETGDQKQQQGVEIALREQTPRDRPYENDAQDADDIGYRAQAPGISRYWSELPIVGDVPACDGASTLPIPSKRVKPCTSPRIRRRYITVSPSTPSTVSAFSVSWVLWFRVLRAFFCCLV